jgi:hypothetical protein
MDEQRDREGNMKSEVLGEILGNHRSENYGDEDTDTPISPSLAIYPRPKSIALRVWVIIRPYDARLDVLGFKSRRLRLSCQLHGMVREFPQLTLASASAGGRLSLALGRWDVLSEITVLCASDMQLALMASIYHRSDSDLVSMVGERERERERKRERREKESLGSIWVLVLLLDLVKALLRPPILGDSVVLIRNNSDLSSHV